MKTIYSTFLFFALSVCSMLGQGGPVIRTPLTTNQMMNAPAHLMIPYWNATAGKWSNDVAGIASVTNAQPPSTILTNLSLYGVNYALSNIITVNATANALTNGILLTNAVKEAGTLASATRHILVKLTPGKYITPTNTLPSVMTAVDNVSTYWESGAEWGSGIPTGDSAFQWDFNAGKRTNCNIFGYGRFWLTNAGANNVFIESSSRIIIQGLSFYSTDTPSSGASPFTWDGTPVDITFDVKDFAESGSYDGMYGDVSSGQKLRGRIQELRATGDILELSGDSPAWGNVDLEIPIGRQTVHPGQNSFLQVGGRVRVRMSQVFVTSKSSSMTDGTSTTNGILEGAVIQMPADGTAAPIGFLFPATTASGLYLRNCVIYGPTNVDIGNITNTINNPLTLENCTFYTGWASTNFLRGATPSFVRIIGGLGLIPYKPLGAQISIISTNFVSGERNIGTLVQHGASWFSNDLTVVGADVRVAGDVYSSAGYFDSLLVTNLLNAPNGAGPFTPGNGDLAFDNNYWAASRGAFVTFDGTANTVFLTALQSDTPSNGQVPKWNTGGTITWEDDGGGAGGTNNVAQGIGTADITNAVKRYVVRYNNDTNIVVDWTKTNYVVAWPSNTFTVSWANVPAGGSPAQSVFLEIVNTNSAAGFFPTNGLNNSPVILLSTPSTNTYTFHFDGTNFWTDSGQILTTGLGDTNVFNVNPVIHGATNFSKLFVNTPFTNYNAFTGSPATNILIDAGLGNVFRVLLTNNMGFKITNGYNGQELSVWFYQDGTGNRTVKEVPNTGGALTNNFEFGEDITKPITLTTNQYKKDVLKFIYEETSLSTNTSRSNWVAVGILRKYPN